MLNLLLKKKFVPTEVEPPSITQQGWDVEIVDFRDAKVPGVDYFNPGYVARPEREYLITRRSKFDAKIHVGINDLVAFAMTERLPQVGTILKPMELAFDSHFEDPRAIYFQDHTFIGACNFIWHKEHNLWSGAHQALLKFDHNWKCVERYDIEYGYNESRLAATKGHEKNWIYFEHGGALHLLYKTHPHTVIKLGKDMNPVAEYITDWDNSIWKYGEPRGGTPPIIGPDGNFWSYFHSSIDNAVRNKRRYFTGVYCFESKPPFNVIGITPEPILIASKHDRWAPGKPAVTFPGGAILKDGVWTVSFGVNDFDSALGFFPHEKIDKLVKIVA